MSALARVGLMFGTADVPVDPDRDQGQQWILEELSKPEYAAAKPTWWDLLSKAVWDWFNSLSLDGGSASQVPLLAALLLIVAGVIVAAYFIFGRPRLNRRSAAIGSLFGEDEERTSEALRRAANAAAARADWTLAIEELFRALARAMAERVLVTTDPGTTASGFAVRAGVIFPDHSHQLMSSAAIFDNVRYLGRDGTEADYNTLAQLERELRSASPPASTPVPLEAAR